MPVVMITGGTGLIGKALTQYLVDKGYAVIILTRKLPAGLPASEKIEYAVWDIERGYIDKEALQKTDYIIHLAGAGVMNKKWTPAYKKEIIGSRVESGKLIVQLLAQTPTKVKAVISCSAIGYYGPDKNPAVPFTETDVADTSFLGETCRLWEEAVQPVSQLNKRLTILRIGIVLDKHGGALKEFMFPLKFRVAAIMGNGKQIMSWVHINDLCRMFLFAIENENIQGTYNAVSPNPVSNKIFMQLLGKIKWNKFFLTLPVPSFMLKLLLGGRSIEILKSAMVSSKKIENAGFSFQFSNVEKALKNLVED